MKITVHHPTEDGNRQIKVVQNVKDVVYDYGFELHRKHIPAVKLITNCNPYYLLNVHDAENLVLALKKSTKDVELGINIFDPDLLTNEKALSLMQGMYLRKFFEKVNAWDYRNTDAFKIFTTSEVGRLAKCDLYPIRNRNVTSLVELWAATMPTPYKPINISKTQYFYALLHSYRRANERRTLLFL